jgi:hypothetical protein
MDKVLSALGATWKTVEATTASFSNVPDGDYIGDLKEIKLGQSKKKRWQVEFTWEMADGEQVGKTQKQFYGISTNEGQADAVGMGYFKGVAEVLGLDLPEDGNLWQAVFDEFIEVNSNALYDITIKSNKEFANVYVNGISEYTKGGEGGEGEETVEEATEEETVEEAIEEEAVEEVTEEEVVVEEEAVQEVVMPTKKIVAKVAAKPVAKVAAKPVAKVAVKPVVKVAPVAKVATKVTAQPVKKIVTLPRR